MGAKPGLWPPWPLRDSEDPPPTSRGAHTAPTPLQSPSLPQPQGISILVLRSPAQPQAPRLPGVGCTPPWHCPWWAAVLPLTKCCPKRLKASASPGAPPWCDCRGSRQDLKSWATEGQQQIPSPCRPSISWMFWNLPTFPGHCDTPGTAGTCREGWTVSILHP